MNNQININEKYIELLKIMASLSGLFSNNKIPYLYYRNAENLFCYALRAKNLSRDDSAFDALLNINDIKIGVGLKTFICERDHSLEKVAEFNQLSSSFNISDSRQLAKTIAKARNERIRFAHRIYGVNSAIYHLVTRRKDELRIFEENYDLIDIDNIKIDKHNNKILSFSDEKNFYNYNFSKSTLFKRFDMPKVCKVIPVKIIKEPYDLLLKLKDALNDYDIANFDSLPQIVLPLYSTRDNSVPLKSGLNQWNANGRKRDNNEVYIPVPKYIHDKYPDFFPSSNTTFSLITPDGQTLQAKICQQNGKALMTNPNSALANWLLRQLLALEPKQLATMEHLKLIDCDSVTITKINDAEFKIDKAKFGEYKRFSEK